MSSILCLHLSRRTFGKPYWNDCWLWSRNARESIQSNKSRWKRHNSAYHLYGCRQETQIAFYEVSSYRAKSWQFYRLPDPENPSKDRNMEPGTVVDSEIVSPNGKEFILCSHRTQQGTVRPTRYTVCINDFNIDPDSLQVNLIIRNMDEIRFSSWPTLTVF